jgi:phosphatidylglycerol:prolipoprotein diacylglycerol transferase
MLKHPDIDPVAFSVGPLDVHWYGLMYLGGFAAAWWLANRRAGRPDSPVSRAQVEDVIFYAALGVILGGRFGYVLFYNFGQFLQDPLWLFRVWEGGMSFHGGLLGVIAALGFYAWRKGIHPGRLFDFAAPLVPIGLGLGRLGNFIGQELWGRAADLPWAMLFPKDPAQLPRHPSQLYQLALEGVLLFAILWWYSSRPRPTWSVGALFLLCYGLFRFIVEFFREPDSHIGLEAFGWMSRGQILSLPMIVIGAAVLVYSYRRRAVAHG